VTGLRLPAELMACQCSRRAAGARRPWLSAAGCGPPAATAARAGLKSLFVTPVGDYSVHWHDMDCIIRAMPSDAAAWRACDRASGRAVARWGLGNAQAATECATLRPSVKSVTRASRLAESDSYSDSGGPRTVTP
jgi:hypothetical protein